MGFASAPALVRIGLWILAGGYSPPSSIRARYALAGSWITQ